MQQVNIHEAKTHLSKLIEKAAHGEPFIIAKAGKPLVKVMPIDVQIGKHKKRLGFLQDQFTIPEDFDHLGSEEISRLFEGE